MLEKLKNYIYLNAGKYFQEYFWIETVRNKLNIYAYAGLKTKDFEVITISDFEIKYKLSCDYYDVLFNCDGKFISIDYAIREFFIMFMNFYKDVMTERRKNMVEMDENVIAEMIVRAGDDGSYATAKAVKGLALGSKSLDEVIKFCDMVIEKCCHDN